MCSRFNGQITTRLLTGARGQLAVRDVEESSTTTVWVPGVHELPVAARALAMSGSVDAVVCLGAAIRGETSRHDFVAGAVANACRQGQLEVGTPISSGVVTTDDLQQALELSGGRYGNRGAETVDTAIEMASWPRELVAVDEVPASPLSGMPGGRPGLAGAAPSAGGPGPGESR